MSHENDHDLPDDLHRVLALADPLPYDTLQSLRACFTRRSLDAELAELVYDSLLNAPVGVRSGEAGRQLSFQGPRVAVEMEVVAERQRVVGQLVPPQPSQVEVRHAGGSYVLHSDRVGRFVADEIPKGPVSFRCTGATGDDPFVTVTDWIVL
ncbi:MAG: hypothetical protein ACRD12_16885 [Acidimicrobiales bacterium]